MSSKGKSAAICCWQPFRRRGPKNSDDDDDDTRNTNNNQGDDGNPGSSGGGAGLEIFSGNDPLLWSRDLEKHFLGEFSFSVVQANQIIEDRSQVETGRNATFVGVYDGHGGHEAAHFVSDNLFTHFIKLARESRTMSEDVISNTFAATEEEFIRLVYRTHSTAPRMDVVGSCCLVGLIWGETLYVANLGDSRAVLGRLGRSNEIVAEQLTTEHNASNPEIREELRRKNPDDSSIVIEKEGFWRVKGIIQITRAIGDAFMKIPGLVIDPSLSKFKFSEPLRRPALTAEPSVRTRALTSDDQFLIFASDGLWEHVTNEEAVEIVYNSPRAGIAKRLAQEAVKRVARRLKVSYEILTTVGSGERRKCHDDITVVVIFLDHNLLNQETSQPMPELSVHGFIDSSSVSKFNVLQQTT